jgi:hypothetical protein
MFHLRLGFASSLFFLVSKLQSCKHALFPLNVLRSQITSPSLNAQPYNHPANSDNCEAPHCSVFSNLLPLPFVKSKCSWHRQFLYRHATNPGGSEIFRTRPDRSWGSTSLLLNGYRLLPGDKTPGEWRLPPTPSIAEVKEREEIGISTPL